MRVHEENGDQRSGDLVTGAPMSQMRDDPPIARVMCQVNQSLTPLSSAFNHSGFLIKLMISMAESKHKTHPVLVIQIFNPSLGIPSCLRVGSG